MLDAYLTMLSIVTVFFLVTLASKQIGVFFSHLKMPLITGFLFIGMLAGPYILKIISVESIHKLRFVDEISLAFIAFAAGSELVVRQIKSRFKSIHYTTIALVLSTFSIGVVAFFLMSKAIPFAKNMSPAHRLGVSLLAGAILVARSPSSAIAVVNELRAKGPFTTTALGVTVIMDVVVITLFSLCSSIAGTLLAGASFDVRFLLILIVELGLSVVIGIVLSYVLRFILARHCRKWIKTMLIVSAGYSAFLVSDAARHFSLLFSGLGILLEPMLICMLAGFMTANYSTYRTELMKVLHDISPFVYVAFFTLTGASMRLNVLTQCWAIALGLFMVRLSAIVMGSFFGGLFAGEPMKTNKIAWMCYITQAGVGLGLAKQVTVEFGQWGTVFATIMIAVIVLNQIVGPPLFKWALHLAEEAKSKTDSQSSGDIRDVIIFGLEGESLALARLLQSNNWEVKIATTQIHYVRKMAADSDIEIHPMPDISLQTLNKLGVAHTDSIVAMLSDEENYAICELVNENYGIRNFIVRLNQRTYFKRFHELGVLVVEPGTAIVNLLDQFVRSPSAARLLLGLEQGREIFEMELRNADFQGVAIRDLHLPLDLHILSIRRNGQLIITVGFTRLQIGDWLTVVGSRPSLEQMMFQFSENREFALVHMVGQAASKKIASKSLDNEVKAIIHNDDDQRSVRFHRLIENSAVLDLDELMTYQHFFGLAADRISVSLDVSKEKLLQLLMEREKESSTAFRPDLAIPHIIIEGRNAFHIMLARNRKGIYYSELAPKVTAVFVLAGSRDQRDYHLYVLSAIAKIVQQPYFHQRWLKAHGDTALRHIVQSGKIV